MRLKRYINEAIVLADKKALKLYMDTFDSVYKGLILYLEDDSNIDKWDDYEDMIAAGSVKLVELMNKKFDKTKSKTGIIFYPIPKSGLDRRDAGAGLTPGMERQKWQISFNYDPWLTVNIWNTSFSKYREWLLSQMETIEHELIHIGQLKAMKKNIRRWYDFEQIVFKGMQKAYAYDEEKHQTYVKNWDNYVADRKEVMAFASNAAREMNHEQDWKQTMKDVKTTSGQEWLAHASEAFGMFWEYKDVMVKTWRRFLKYFIDYVKRYRSVGMVSEELVISDQYDRVVGRKKLKFTKKNIEKIAYQFDAEVERIELDIKHAVLRDHLGRLLWVDGK